MTLAQTINTSLTCSVQSTDTGGDALYIVQFDVTVRSSQQLAIGTSFGAAAFGAENISVPDYKRPHNKEKDAEDAEKAENLANKKRKVKLAKDLTLPVRDAE